MYILLRPRNLAIGLLLFVVGALLVPSINFSRYRWRVATALSDALGRRVEVGGVHLEMFPWPALVAENVVVNELSAIGAEPLARMNELRAAVRLRSLWTGRPSFSSVVFVDPSVNLSRAHFAAVPSTTGGTTSRSSGPTLGSPLGLPPPPQDFPYLEFRDGRVNFKTGDLKSIYFFSEVNGAVYREDHHFRLRLRGRPARTDYSLNGAGEVRVEGTVERGGSRQVDLQARLVNAFLSDLLAMSTGRNPGIQGKFDVDMRVAGHPSALRLEGRAQVAELHRGDFLPPIATSPVAWTFSGSADLPARRLQMAELRSEAGTVTAFGDVHGFLAEDQPFDWNLQVRLKGADASRWFKAVRHFSPRFSGQLQVAGTMDGAIHFQRGPDGPVGEGEVLVSDLVLRAPNVPVITASDARIDISGAMLRMRPVAISARGERPLLLDLAFDWTNAHRGPRLVQVHAAGQNLALSTWSPLAAVLGWPGLPASGRVSMDAHVTLESGLAPAYAGSLNLSRVRWTPAWLALPVQVHNLRFDLAPHRIRLSNLVAEAGESTVTGAIERTEDRNGQPRWTADLRVNESGAGPLGALFATRNPMPLPLAQLQAEGKISATHFHLPGMLIEDFQSPFRLAERHVTLLDTRARVSNGRVNGKVDLDFRDVPEYKATLRLNDVLSEGLAAGLKLTEGAISGSLQLETNGRTAGELAAALELTGNFTARSLRIKDESLARELRLDRPGAVAADVEVRDRVLRFTRLSLAGPPSLEATGTVQFDRRLDLDFQSFRLTGTLTDPRRMTPAEVARGQQR